MATEMYRINVDGIDYQRCVDTAHEWWATKKEGEWGGGLIGRQKAILIGSLGEMAFARYLGVNPSLEYIDGGGGQDFTLNGVSFEIKTAARNYGKGLVRHSSGSGYRFELDSDWYVFCYVDEYSHKPQSLTADVVLKGFCPKHVLKPFGPVPAMKGSHKNYEIPHSTLNSDFSMIKQWHENQRLSSMDRD